MTSDARPSDTKIIRQAKDANAGLRREVTERIRKNDLKKAKRAALREDAKRRVAANLARLAKAEKRAK